MNVQVSRARRALAVVGATALTGAALVVPIQSAHAGDPVGSTISYPTFDAPLAAPWTLTGDAAIVGAAGSKVLRVTSSFPSRAGSSFTTSKISFLNDGSFSTSFSFNFNSQGNSGGADGLVFTVQNVSNSVGTLGGGIGYQGIDKSIGIEFDNWFNGGVDPDDNHVGIDVNGDIASNPAVASPVPLDDPTALHRAWVDYNGATDLLEVRVADSNTRPAAALLTKTLDLPNILGGGTDVSDAFVGFTSATGAAWANHDIHSWTLTNCYQPIDTPPTVLAGGPYSGAEGSPTSLAGSVTDDGAATSRWTYAVDSADAGATCSFADATSSTTTVTCTDDGSYTLTLTGDDSVSDPITSTATLTVSNVAPSVASVTAAFTAACTVAATATFTDAGTNDTHSATLAWGDGASGAASVTETDGAGTATGSHTYSAAGTYSVTATVTDDDTGSDTGMASVTTKNVAGAFGAPIGAGANRSVFKLGSTIPVKVTVTDCSGAKVTTLSPTVELDKVDASPAGPVNTAEVTEVATNGKQMRWTDDHYHYNLSTKRSEFFGGAALTAGSYRLTVTDPTLFAPATAWFDLR